MSLLPKNLQVLHTLLEEYQTYKERFVRNMVFLPGEQSIVGRDFKTLGSWKYFQTGANPPLPPAVPVDSHRPVLVQIYFTTATFDQIDRDVLLTVEAQLGLIGGTMGLLTGFSILSGVEIVYFTIKFILSLRIRSHLHLYKRNMV